MFLSKISKIVVLYLLQISEDAELLWRLARASRDLAQLSGTSAEEKKALVYEALDYATRALEKNEASFAAHKVRRLRPQWPPRPGARCLLTVVPDSHSRRERDQRAFLPFGSTSSERVPGEPLPGPGSQLSGAQHWTDVFSFPHALFCPGRFHT